MICWLRHCWVTLEKYDLWELRKCEKCKIEKWFQTGVLGGYQPIPKGARDTKA